MQKMETQEVIREERGRQETGNMKNIILYVSDEEATAIETLLSDTEDRDGITAQELDSQEHQGPIRHPEIQEHAIRIQEALSDMRNALGRHNVTVYTDGDAYNPVKAVAAQMQRLMVRMHTARTHKIRALVHGIYTRTEEDIV